MPSIEARQTAGTIQQQTLTLSSQQQLGLELLQLPLPDLELRLTEELNRNPVLEESLPELPSNPADTGNDSDFNLSEPEMNEWSADLSMSEEEREAASEQKVAMLGNSAAPAPTLAELLMIEFETASLPERLQLPAAEIISSIDPDGYLRTPLADLAMSCDAAMEDMEDALKAVQALAPPGVGARDLTECLKLQLERKGLSDERMNRLLECGLNDIENGNFDTICTKLSISRTELDELLAILRQLDPLPGHRQTASNATVIIPELEIFKKEDGSFAVRPLRENFRRLIISSRYEQLLEQKTLSPDDRQYLQEKLARARELIKSLEMRESTLNRLGEVIIDRQLEFLEQGTSKLKTLTMKEAGSALDVVESTISRAVADKYIRTPHGVFPLRFFFSSGGGKSSDGENIAAAAVLEEIRRIIDNENPADPLSDGEIAAVLARKDIKIARRTVAKYREQLNIPKVSERRH